MSWIRLLSTSRSFSGQDIEPRGYRLTQMNLIPKFGHPGGSARVTGLPARPASGAPATRKIPVVRPLPRGPVAPTPPPAPAPVPTASPLSKAAAQWQRLAGGARFWLAATGGFFGQRMSRKRKHPFHAGNAAARATAARPAQPELRLEAVRPVHNDLTDCDFEVRPVRPGAAALEPLAGLVARPPRALETASGAWERVRTLFH
jgi:hypothetical protein